MKFTYPTQNIHSLDNFYAGMHKGGFYPIGAANKWHGGVHICKNNPICAIADGEVVAYRLEDEKDENEECKDSNNFILIKHQYESANEQKLTFYSLYAHLLSYDQMVKQEKIADFFYKCKKVWELLDRRNLRKWDAAKNDVNKTDAGIIKLIPKGTILYEVELSGTEEKKAGFEKVKCTVGGEEFTGFMDIRKVVNEKHEEWEWEWDKDTFPIEEKKVKGGIAIPVEAGNIIGHPGLWDGERLFHFEIFAPNEDEVKDFLANKKEDGESQKLFFKLPKDTKLQKKYPRPVMKGWKVEVQEGDKYSLVTVTGKEAIVSRKDDLDAYNAATKQYTIKFSDQLNQKFDGLLKPSSVLNYINDPQVEKDAKGKDTNNRKVRFDYSVILIAPKGDVQLNDNNELTADLKTLYDLGTKNMEKDDKIEEDRFFYRWDLRRLELGDDVWYYIVEEEDDVEGWIKEDDPKLEKISAYEWEKWGFQWKKESPEDFVFEHSDHNAFMNDVCDYIEDMAAKAPRRVTGISDGIKKDGQVGIAELQLALKNRNVKSFLSRLVCWHLSEWSGEKASDAYCKQKKKMIDDAIKNAPSYRKQNLEDERDALCDELKEKIEKMGFWNDVADLPSNGQVFHFHPIAFVEQMKKMRKWHDPVLNPQINKYEFSGTVSPKSACFGYTRKNGTRFHHGLDIFAVPKTTKVYACLDSKYISAVGSVVTLEIINTEELIDQKDWVNYRLQYPDNKEYLAGVKKATIGTDPQGEKRQFVLSETDTIQFKYIHLDSWVDEIKNMKKGDLVKAGTHIAYAGVKSAEGTHAPHLHLEILNITAGTGFILNPALFIHLHSFHEKEQKEANKKWT